MSIRLLTVKDTSGTNLRTFHAQFSEKGSECRKDNSEINFCLKKDTLLVTKSR